MYKKKDDTTLRVEQPTALLDFIQSKMGGMAKTSVKQLLSQRRVTVNGAVQTRHDTPLQSGDTVVISSGRGNIQLHHPKLRMVFEDDHLIVVEKQVGLLTVPTFPGSTETTVFSILKAYVRRQNPRAGIYTVLTVNFAMCDLIERDWILCKVLELPLVDIKTNTKNTILYSRPRE